MRILISSFGNLFFKQVVKILKNDLDVTLIGGALPRERTALFLEKSNKILKSNLITRWQKRYDPELSDIVKRCSLAEYLFMTSNKIFKNNDFASFLFHIYYGFCSRKYIHNADILHVRSGSGRGGAIKKAKKQGIKVVVDHSIANRKYIESVLKDEYEKYKIKFDYDQSSKFWKIVQKDCDEADLLLVNSDFVKETFIKYGYKPNKIKVLYLGVRKDFFNLKRSYKIDATLKILFVGTFGFRKGGEYILKALDILNSRNFKYKFTLIGPTNGFDDIIEKYNTSNIEFINYVKYDDLKSYYSNSDIFLFPSLCEGSTRAGMEAMAAGLPVIVTQNCGIPVTDNVNGTVVNIKDEYSIVEAIVELYSSQEKRERIGMSASETIIKNYKWDDYKTNLINLYKVLLDEKQ